MKRRLDLWRCFSPAPPAAIDCAGGANGRQVPVDPHPGQDRAPIEKAAKHIAAVTRPRLDLWRETPGGAGKRTTAAESAPNPGEGGGFRRQMPLPRATGPGPRPRFLLALPKAVVLDLALHGERMTPKSWHWGGGGPLSPHALQWKEPHGVAGQDILTIARKGFGVSAHKSSPWPRGREPQGTARHRTGAPLGAPPCLLSCGGRDGPVRGERPVRRSLLSALRRGWARMGSAGEFNLWPSW
jgi:hypothetical protein